MLSQSFILLLFYDKAKEMSFLSDFPAFSFTCHLHSCLLPPILGIQIRVNFNQMSFPLFSWLLFVSPFLFLSILLLSPSPSLLCLFFSHIYTLYLPPHHLFELSLFHRPQLLLIMKYFCLYMTDIKVRRYSFLLPFPLSLCNYLQFLAA